MKIVLATANAHKVAEIKAIFESLGDFELVTVAEVGFVGEIDEVGETFEENSLIKAKTVSEFCSLPTVADDSGLAVDFLDGAPGVQSARFGGGSLSAAEKNKKLVAMLEGVEPKDRTAHFVSVITLYMPDGKFLSVRGECDGIILSQPEGDSGFGYDPLFYYPPLGKTFAQMDAATKNTVSHRSKALQEFVKQLPGFLNENDW